ncbi:MAG TPA: histidine triad nucleotide-binding protein [Gemmatimonadaceae bacterium]|nr:histidine triad nucleotide-binding protein [Gemmatimonadaceae bacterium]
MAEDCLFCRIVGGQIPASIVTRTDDVVVFRDINPQAPTHLLVIPTKHVASLNDADASDDLGRLMRAAVDAAKGAGIAESGYRIVINAGENGGQTVSHLHLHVLGGRRMAWPPG